MLISSGYYDGITLSGDGIPVFAAIIGGIIVIVISVNLVPSIVHKWETEYKTRDLTYGAVCLALAYALSWLGISLPLGGTLTVAALLPVYIYCYYFGFRKGMILAAAYLFLQFTQKVYIVHPLSALFDYVIPYFSLCVVGLFKYDPQKYQKFIARYKDKTGAASGIKYWLYTVGGHFRMFLGAALHMLIRYVSLVISGVICWDYWGYDAADLAYKLTYSLGYNSFALFDSLIAIAAAAVLLSSRTFNRYMSANFSDKKDLDEDAAQADAERNGKEQGGE